ncbi:MAG: hypothetical protein OXH63_25780, partial [Gemmatimonadetes bacterium]|nr:hypothetical protein [Gemmatimonadota bacterium]
VFRPPQHGRSTQQDAAKTQQHYACHNSLLAASPIQECSSKIVKIKYTPKLRVFETKYLPRFLQ